MHDNLFLCAIGQCSGRVAVVSMAGWCAPSPTRGVILLNATCSPVTRMADHPEVLSSPALVSFRLVPRGCSLNSESGSVWKETDRCCFRLWVFCDILDVGFYYAWVDSFEY
ncbi:hypothetical protein CDAR_314441 [Caerostris darwini]|uniref:Secreted protein n=1 Tax=Caerostris darwini TaxID=1538125 RepID=A0AAV4TLD7_9ARAC|nr:hypothetical protein CDAR_314441 [Caerostris darwini]